MKSIDRKAAIAAYKERKPVPAIYVVRCLATGEEWIGESRNIDTQQNGIWFALRQGAHLNRDAQAAWNKYGPDGFAFEVVERLPEEENPQFLRAELKARAAFWLKERSARKL
ncbi:MAG: GIY-YIG nuclease family protein [Alphaproteobacteria bacterium]|nr:GIY-YIG nuclease family protein [Alphaproteobacteria bacterium]